jgi:hypothetical protein
VRALTSIALLSLCAILLCVGPVCAQDATSGIRIETGALTAINSTADLGAALSVGAQLPSWVPLIGNHFGFIDALTAAGCEAIGASVSIKPAATDDGWRIGATLTKPDSGEVRRVEGYIRYGVAITF